MTTNIVKTIVCALSVSFSSVQADEMNKKKLKISDPEKAIKEDKWNSCAAIALGDGYSIILQFKPASEFLAEYYRRVMVFSGGDRVAKLSGSLQLMMNTGGRTHVLIYRHSDTEGKITHFTAEDQSSAQSVRLNKPDFEDPPKNSKKEYIGLISGEAYPLKFITPLIVSEKVARQKLK